MAQRRERLTGAASVPARIGMDALLVADLSEPTRRCVGQFLFALHHFDRFNEYLLYAPRGGSHAIGANCDLPHWRIVETKLPTQWAWLRRLAHQSAFLAITSRDRLDIVHALTAISPFATQKPSLDAAPPVIVTVWEEPSSDRLTAASLQQAWCIAAASGYLARTVQERFEVPEEKVRVMPVGIDPLFIADPFAESAGKRAVVWGQVPAWVREGLQKVQVAWQGLPKEVTGQAAKNALSEAGIVIVTESDGRGSQGLCAAAMGKWVVAVPLAPLQEVLNDAALWLNESKPESVILALERIWDDAAWRERTRRQMHRLTQQRQWTQAVKAWVGLYRRVFEEAIAEFVGW